MVVRAKRFEVFGFGFAVVSGPVPPVMDLEVPPVRRTLTLWSWAAGKGAVSMAREFSQEFKDQIVELHRRGRSNVDIAREFGISATTVANWVREGERREARRVARESDGGDDKARIARLERELARKEEELEILGKALAFFARRADQ
jgi:transposase